MHSIISDLYHGDIHPLEQICPTDEQYRKIGDRICDELTYLTGKLSAEDLERFKKLESMLIQTSSMQEEACFCYGFKLGAGLLAAVYNQPLQKKE